MRFNLAVYILAFTVTTATRAGEFLPRDYRGLCGDWVRFLAPHEIETHLQDYDRVLEKFFPKTIRDPAGLKVFARSYKNFVLNREKIKTTPDSEAARVNTATSFESAGKGARILQDYAAAAILYSLAAVYWENAGVAYESSAKHAYEISAFAFERLGELTNDDEYLAIASIFYEWVGLRSKCHLISVHLIFPERVEQLKRGMYDPPRFHNPSASEERRTPPKKQDSRTNAELLKALQLSEPTTAAEIKRARNRLAAKFHSDLHPDLSAEARKLMDAEFSKVAEAFNELRSRGLTD